MTTTNQGGDMKVRHIVLGKLEQPPQAHYA